MNNQFVQWLLKWGLSRSGIVVQYAVGLAIGGLAKAQIFPEGDLKEIETGLTSGLTAIVASVYGIFVWWLQHRQKDGVRTLQTQLNASVVPTKEVATDGIAGNETVKAAAEVTGVPVEAAVASVAAAKS